MMTENELDGPLDVIGAWMAYRSISFALFRKLVETAGPNVELDDMRESIRSDLKGSHSDGPYEMELHLVASALRTVDEFFTAIEIDPANRDR